MTKTLRTIVGSMLLACMAISPAAAQAGGLQCAPYARMFSGIQLFGAAASWWNQAVGKYMRGNTPAIGSVLVFKAIGSMRSGHVATVSQIVSDRIIKVTHANWSVINGSRGKIERDVTVVDASAKGDWSQVKVWFAPIGKVGNKAYPVNGFIYNNAATSASVATADHQG
jgi:surface antigen